MGFTLHATSNVSEVRTAINPKYCLNTIMDVLALSYTPCDVNKDNIDPEGEIETAGRVLCLTLIRGNLPPEAC